MFKEILILKGSKILTFECYINIWAHSNDWMSKCPYFEYVIEFEFLRLVKE